MVGGAETAIPRLIEIGRVRGLGGNKDGFGVGFR